jgi:5-formyltetrahydrofolate cyclo-ligase
MPDDSATDYPHRVGRTKSEWRRWAEAQHATIDHVAASAQIVDVLHRTLGFDQHTLTFLPMSDEVDLTRLDRPHLYVTRTPTVGALTVHSFDAPRERHPWGYEQPIAAAPEIAPATLDVVLVPGVVFAVTGTRIGHGKGYYDQLLASCRTDTQRIGITFDALVVDSLPAEAHDIPMDAIVTESGLQATAG